MTTLELFVQGEGMTDIIVVEIPGDANGYAFLEQARVAQPGSLVIEKATRVYLEDADEPLVLERPLEASGVGHHSRLHVHRCQQVLVSVHFQARTIERRFSPAATVARVHTWAVGTHGFALTPVDAAEHALQICQSVQRPDEDVHIGTLVQHDTCTLCCDLVPKVRVEGWADNGDQPKRG